MRKSRQRPYHETKNRKLTKTNFKQVSHVCLYSEYTISYNNKQQNYIKTHSSSRQSYYTTKTFRFCLISLLRLSLGSVPREKPLCCCSRFGFLSPSQQRQSTGVNWSYNSKISTLQSQWLGGVTVRASDLRSSDRGFDSWSGRYQV